MRDIVYYLNNPNISENGTKTNNIIVYELKNRVNIIKQIFGTNCFIVTRDKYINEWKNFRVCTVQEYYINPIFYSIIIFDLCFYDFDNDWRDNILNSLLYKCKYIRFLEKNIKINNNIIPIIECNCGYEIIEDECNICLNNYTSNLTKCCSKNICISCFNKWKQITCPYCRNIDRYSLTLNIEKCKYNP